MPGFASKVCAFAGRREGNIAMMFGFLLFALVAFAGAAVDLNRATMTRTRVAEAVDAAILAAARQKWRDPSKTNEELEALARAMFDASVGSDANLIVHDFDLSFDAETSEFSLRIDSGLRTTMTRLLGQDELDVSTEARVGLGKPRPVELVMALDNTGSMNSNGKLAALKEASTDLINALFAHPEAQVKIGLVPFAQYVNIGEDFADEEWLTTPPGGGWMGCVGSRSYPNNIEDDDYATEDVPGLNGAACPQALLSLTDVKTDALEAIDDMTAGGWTYIPSGLAWGWRALTPNPPLDEGAPFDEFEADGGVKALILMTDGQNTRAPDYPTHNAANQLYADDLTEELCENIKEQKIVLYTIAFDVTSDSVRDLLEDCATSSENYFNAEDSERLSAAFAAIATDLQNLTLTK